MSEENALNAQITDAVAQINASVNGASAGLVVAAACQTIAHALALGVQNGVAQQQQAYILRNAMVSAASAAVLDGKREEAEAVAKSAESEAQRKRAEDSHTENKVDLSAECVLQNYNYMMVLKQEMEKKLESEDEQKLQEQQDQTAQKLQEQEAQRAKLLADAEEIKAIHTREHARRYIPAPM